MKFYGKPMQALHSVAFGRPMVGLVQMNNEFYNFINQLAFLVKKINLGEEIVEGWQEDVREEVDLVNSGTIYDEFVHAACAEANFVHVLSTRIPNEEKEMYLNNIKGQVDKMMRNDYIKHFLGQLYDFGNHTDEEIEDFFTVNPNHTRQPSPFVEIKLAEAVELFRANSFCSLCFKKFSDLEAILSQGSAKVLLYHIRYVIRYMIYRIVYQFCSCGCEFFVEQYKDMNFCQIL